MPAKHAKKRQIALFIIFILGALSVASAISSAPPATVIINEVAWMGTESSANDEWLELYNGSDAVLNLDGWRLEAIDGTPAIQLSGTLPAYSFYLLERTDDNTMPGVTADLIYKGALGNSGEKLVLGDSAGNVIDLVDSSSGWFGGDNTLKKTMERKSAAIAGSDTGSWQTSLDAGGTPRASNSSGATILPASNTLIQQEKQGESKTATSVPPHVIQSATTPATYPSGIVLNEVLPSPEGPDGQEEWIELANLNDFTIDLSGWQIADTAGSIKIYTLPGATNINPGSFIILSRPDTKIVLNNDGDGIVLKNPSGDIADQVNYPKAQTGQSYLRNADEDWSWSSTPTPGAKNISAVNAKENNALEIEGEFPADDTAMQAKAGNPSSLSSGTNKALLFAIAITLAVSSGIFMLFLKRRLKE